MLTKMNVLILSCILLSVTSFKVSAATDSNQSDQLSGAHTARVTVSKAIVYSDENMSSPLGYISNDKLITVGNPRKKNPDLLPIVVYGRLAFIEAKNIHFENESVEAMNSKRGAPREHNIDIILTKPEEKLSENNSGYISLHQFSAGLETQTLVNAIDATDENKFIGYSLSLIHRQTPGRVFWGAGYEYNTLSTSNFKFSNYILNPIIGYTPIKNSLFLVDLIFSLDFSLSSQLVINNNLAEEPSAFLWGPQLGARIVFFPNQKYHAFGSFGYRSYKVLRLENVNDPTDTSIPGITKINGVNLSIGLAIEI
jgi:hypothetical protein